MNQISAPESRQSRLLQGHEVLGVFGIHSVKPREMAGHVHRLEMPDIGTTRFDREYVAGIKALSLEHGETRVTIGSATLFADSPSGARCFSAARISLDTALYEASNQGRLNLDVARAILNVGWTYINKLQTEDRLQVHQKPDGSFVSLQGVRALLDWRRPGETG